VSFCFAALTQSVHNILLFPRIVLILELQVVHEPRQLLSAVELSEISAGILPDARWTAWKTGETARMAQLRATPGHDLPSGLGLGLGLGLGMAQLRATP
jgi:hypothetical protein